MSNSPRHAYVTFAAPDLSAVELERSRFRNAGLAIRTTQSYDADWRVFNAWCAASGRTALPADPRTVELYATDLIGRGRKLTTVERHSYAIVHIHRKSGHENPCGKELRALLSGARRILSQTPNQKAPLMLADLRGIVKTFNAVSPVHARNRAVLVFGFASALRRASLSTLQIEDVTFTDQGALVRVIHEKQDRKGEGRTIAIPRGKRRDTCPIAALNHWLTFRGRNSGPLFQRVLNGKPNGKPILGNRIGQIVQESVTRIGLDPKKYCGHSLRAGFITEALERGVNEIAIARHTGHASLDTLRLYARWRDPFRGNACSSIGL